MALSHGLFPKCIHTKQIQRKCHLPSFHLERGTTFLRPWIGVSLALLLQIRIVITLKSYLFACCLLIHKIWIFGKLKQTLFNTEKFKSINMALINLLEVRFQSHLSIISLLAQMAKLAIPLICIVLTLDWVIWPLTVLWDQSNQSLRLKISIIC